MRRRWSLVLLLLVALLAVPGVLVLLGGERVLPTLMQFPIERLLLLLGIIVLGWNLNALRLRLLLSGRGKLGQLRALATVMSTEFAFSATPGGSGGPVTLMALLARRGVPPARATAVFATEQLMDLLFFIMALTCLITMLLWDAGGILLTGLEPVKDEPGPLVYAVGMLSLLCLLLVMLARRYRALLRGLTGMLNRLGLPREQRFVLLRRFLRFRDALAATLALPRLRLGAVFLLCCGHWLLRYSVLFLVVAAFGGGLEWSDAFLVQMLSLTAGQLTFLPGGAGGAELVASALLEPYLPLGTVAAAVLVWRFVTFHFYLLAGGPALLALVGHSAWRLLCGTNKGTAENT